MDKKVTNIIVVGVSVIIALKLFIFGLSFPLDYRVRGDAYQYLAIAHQFPDFQTVLEYAGPRTVGIPFIDFTIGRLALSLSGSDAISMLTWANAIGLVLLVTHLVSAWLFSSWLLKTGFIRSHHFALGMFFLLATYPPLIGHTTTPLSDTLTIDLLLIGVIAFHSALHSTAPLRSMFHMTMAAGIIGFAILVRPGNLLPFAAALMVTMIFATFQSARKVAIIIGISLGSVLVLMPFSQNCMQKYGTVCLQSPTTFNFVESAQSGLRGARIQWQKMHLSPGHTPILPDTFMYSRFAQKCNVQHIVGIDQTSLTGCLLSQPMALPVFLVKKWMGLFDHYRFTPYLENITPGWLMSLTRFYDVLAWIGFSLVVLLPFQVAFSREHRASFNEKLVTPLTPLFLISYSVSLLLQHTALHTEDRYGFPLIPLALITLAIYFEKLRQHWHAYRTWWPIGIYCLLAGIVFLAQVRSWDRAVFF